MFLYLISCNILQNGFFTQHWQGFILADFSKTCERKGVHIASTLLLAWHPGPRDSSIPRLLLRKIARSLICSVHRNTSASFPCQNEALNQLVDVSRKFGAFISIYGSLSNYLIRGAFDAFFFDLGPRWYNQPWHTLLKGLNFHPLWLGILHTSFRCFVSRGETMNLGKELCHGVFLRLRAVLGSTWCLAVKQAC